MIRIYFGNPGCGKTTLACRMFKKEKKRYKRKKSPYKYFISNFENKLSNCVSLEGLGKWTFPDYSYVIVDEAGIEYNNRKFKTLPK